MFKSSFYMRIYNFLPWKLALFTILSVFVYSSNLYISFSKTSIKIASEMESSKISQGIIIPAICRAASAILEGLFTVLTWEASAWRNRSPRPSPNRIVLRGSSETEAYKWNEYHCVQKVIHFNCPFESIFTSDKTFGIPFLWLPLKTNPFIWFHRVRWIRLHLLARFEARKRKGMKCEEKL